MARQYQDRIAFLGIAGRDPVGEMEDFVERYGLEFPHAIDADGSLWERFGVPGQPAWVFVDDDGATERILGALSDDDLTARLEALAAG